MSQIAESARGRFYVYEHMRNDTGEIFYVGKGTGHRATVASKFHRNDHWLRIVAKAGGFSARKVVDGLCEELALFIECELIDKYRQMSVKLCNMTDGGDGTSGYVKSEEWRRKVGDAHRGKTISAETRAKISASIKASGYIHSQEVREKISNAHKGHKRALGYKHTDEWKAAQSERSKGNKYSLGKKKSEESKQRMSAIMSGRKQGILKCPHCDKEGGNVMRRFHFENCKSFKATE